MAASNLKDTSDRVLAPIAKSLARSGVTPNSLTILGLIFTVIGAYFLYLGEILTGIFFILAGGLADLLDGLLARYTNMATPLGGFLDSLADRYSDVAIFGGLILGGNIEEFIGFSGAFWGLAALTGAILTSYARAASESKGVSMKGVGLVERPERLIIFCLTGILGFITVGIVILAVLGNVTVAQRLYHFYKTDKDK